MSSVDADATRSAVMPPRAECAVSLGAIRANVRTLSARLTGGSRFWAVVKADAYGHGAVEVSHAAVSAGAARLCVATLSEAWHLRRAGLRVPLLVMGPLDDPSLRRAADLDADVTAVSWTMLDALEAIDPDLGNRRLRVHLKLDTGMGRWGIDPATLPAALDALDRLANVDLVGVMTHFATADFDDRTFLHQQLDLFDGLVAAVRARVPDVLAHAANSGALLNEPRAHLDAVRCGVAMYGLDPMQQGPEAHGLQPALALRSYVADLRERAVGESVGYTRAFVADRPVLVAEVPVGYADGIRRALSGRGEAIVRGRRLPIVGVVSMDQLALLVDDPGDVRVGDAVTLLGSDGDACITAEEHAAIAGTINYEITCGIATEPRLLRTTTDAGGA